MTATISSMPWTWVRPADSSLLVPRPLLDLGTGDGQTLSALASGGLLVGADRSVEALRTARGSRRVCCEATVLPFADEVFRVVLAADLLHHFDEHALDAAFGEVTRVLKPGGTLVAWWYQARGRGGPDSPKWPRTYADVRERAKTFGLDAHELAFEHSVPTVRTAGMIARRTA